MSGFGDQLRGFSRSAGIRFDKIVRKVCLDLMRDLVLATPRDTGMAKSNWFLGTTRVSSIESNVSLNGAPSLGRASDFASTLQAGGVFYIVNNLPYIMKLEYGGYHGPTDKVTASGFSIQAPAGMARISVARAQQNVNAIVRAL